jgi:hypothetical protein
MKYHNGIPADEEAVNEWADRLGFYIKPLAGGRYRLTSYQTLKLSHFENLKAVTSFLCGEQNDYNYALAQLGL